MRYAAASAAAALLLAALAAPACKPDSLTPFSDWREPESAAGNINGVWSGTTATGRQFTFQVGNDTVSKLVLYHSAADCTIVFDLSDETATVEDGSFTFQSFPDQGQVTVEGRFTSDTTCAGTYSFSALAASGSCPTSGSGTFTATKVL